MNRIDDNLLAEWEAESIKAIERGYLAESIEIRSYDWAMLHDSRLKLIESLRSKSPSKRTRLDVPTRV